MINMVNHFSDEVTRIASKAKAEILAVDTNTDGQASLKELSDGIKKIGSVNWESFRHHLDIVQALDTVPDL